MRIPRFCLPFALLVFLAFAIPAFLRAAPPEGNVYLLGIALNQQGDEGSWQRIGPEGAWKNTLAGAVIHDRLYTVETSGILYQTRLDTGVWKAVGRPEFGNTAFMFAEGVKLYTIETNGSLYEVNPATGAWSQVGAAGDWKNTQAGTILNGRLYTIESSGILYATNLNSGAWNAIGRAEFANAAFLFAAANNLFTIEKDGSLHRINPADGSWAQMGGAGGWKGCLAGSVVKGRLYTAQTDGTLWETNLATAARKKIGNPDFGNTIAMFAASNFALTIESDGSLYQVNVKPTTAIDDFDWCPQEIEKAFREQGAPFYRALQVKQILGRQATQANIMGGLSWLRTNATKNDLAVILIDAHGMTDPKKGWEIATADNRQFLGRDLKVQLKQVPCQVLLFIETCTSGGFARSHPEDQPVPPNVTAICACEEDQAANNQLDLAVGEALFGRADFNHDGVVDLDELIRYVRGRYREWMSEPNNSEGNDSPVIVKSAGLPGVRKLTRISPAMGALVDKGELWSALVEGQAGGKYRVHVLGWSSSPGPYFRTLSAARDSICLPSDGPPLLVLQNGHWYGARAVGKSGGNVKVHYLGYNEEEVVTPQRIKYPFVNVPPGKN